MNVTEVLSKTNEALTVKRVYGEPYVKNGLTIIPAASVGGGGGAGVGHDEKGGEGEGGGFGLRERPAGVYVIKGDEVSWRPAVDPNRIFAVVGLVAAAYLFTRPRMARARAAALKKRGGKS